MSKKKVFIYHAHVPLIIREIYKHFPNAKVFSMSREFKSNVSKRINTSFEKINKLYLNKTDEISGKMLRYQHSIESH